MGDIPLAGEGAETLTQAFVEACARYGNKAALKDGEFHFRYRDVLRGASSVAESLSEMGASERVGLLAVNGMDFVCGFFGTLLSGRVVAPLNYMLAPEEVGALVKYVGAETLVVSKAFDELGAALPARAVNAQELWTSGKGELREPDVSADSAAVVICTSGTTSRPKGVVLSHRNLLSNSLAAVEWFGFNEKDRLLCVLPLFHSFALNTLMLVPIFSGACTIYHKRFSPVSALREIERERVTILIAVASMCKVLVASELSEKADVSSLRCCVAGGERVPDAVAEGVEKVMGMELLQGYGLTEASPVVAANNPEYSRRGTVGKPIPGVTVKVVDEQGREVPAGTEGEVLVQGECVMVEYLDMPEETKEALTEDGWLRTGDVGFVDEEGFITLTARKKELIICGGINVSPYRVEEVIASHPGVREAVVVGKEDPTRGEVPVAFVVRVEGHEVDEGELKRFCRKTLAGYEVPRRFCFVEDFPRTAAGKVLRGELVSRASRL